MDMQFSEFVRSCLEKQPPQCFQMKPCTSKAAAAETSRMIEDVCSLKEAAAEPFLPATGRLLQQIVYKQAAPQRHQTFFMAFRRMHRTVKKYNDRSNYIKLLTQIEQKASTSKAVYTLTEEVIRFIAASFIDQLYLLETIRSHSLQAATQALGQIQMTHWEKLSLVLVAACAEVNDAVWTEMERLKQVYAKVGKHFNRVDQRFPNELNELAVARRMAIRPKRKQQHKQQNRVQEILQMTDE
ncbi:hypothetical protein WR25_08197 [Diploscapter pachys]|uniref:Nucleolus and neural progenitor protein-like N-terminal domain-containing protein n=1 Tax=Diploscapter pachys TaxID=2018661 RepID=A0A2A2LA04_9BILA|nr:hypothetical protein WR25_08197 [Diploscapter pachys]